MVLVKMGVDQDRSRKSRWSCAIMGQLAGWIGYDDDIDYVCAIFVALGWIDA